MKKLKITICSLLVLCSCFVFAACGENEEDKAPLDTSVYVATETALRTAISQSTGENVIKLTENIDLVTGIEISETTVVLNLNGKTLTAVNDTAGDGIFLVTGTGKLTIEGEGTINSATQCNNYSMAIWAKNGGEVVINGGTFVNLDAKSKENDGVTPNNNELIYAGSNGTITINGGKFVGNYHNEANGAGYTLNVKDNTNGSIVVKGGTFANYSPEHNNEHPSGSFVATGYRVESLTDNDNGITYYTVVAE